MESTFRAGGLASGLDTNTIIDQLSEIQRQPILDLEQKQEAFRVQLSGIGNLMGRLDAFNTATQALAENGVLLATASESASGFSAVADTGAPVGTYDIQVNQMARAAKARGAAFTDSQAQVTGGTLSLDVGGTVTDITMDDGEALSDIAFKINSSGAAVTASIVNDGTSSYLTITANETGHAIGDPAASALTITETSTGGLGQALGLGVIQEAQNALFNVDGLDIERKTNTVTDVVQDTTITLNSVTAAPENLVLQRDVDGTKAAIQAFVDAYNGIMEIVQGDLDIGEDTDRNKTLGGDPSLRGLQSRLKRLMTSEVAAAGTNIRTLVDIGIESQRDGMLVLNEDGLKEALRRDETAIVTIFDGAAGIAEQVEAMRDLQNDGDEGILSARQDGLNARIDRIDVDIESYELRIEAFRAALIAKFTAMEEIISRTQTIGNFLAQQEFPGFGGDN